jgi:acyl carrier protein
MHPASLQERVVELVSKVLHVAPDAVGPSGRIDETPKWDSLAQLNVLLLLEQEFGVTVEPEQGVELTSVAAICDYLRRQGHDA